MGMLVLSNIFCIFFWKPGPSEAVRHGGGRRTKNLQGERKKRKRREEGKRKEEKKRGKQERKEEEIKRERCFTRTLLDHCLKSLNNPVKHMTLPTVV